MSFGAPGGRAVNIKPTPWVYALVYQNCDQLRWNWQQLTLDLKEGLFHSIMMPNASTSFLHICDAWRSLDPLRIAQEYSRALMMKNVASSPKTICNAEWTRIWWQKMRWRIWDWISRCKMISRAARTPRNQSLHENRGSICRGNMLITTTHNSKIACSSLKASKVVALLTSYHKSLLSICLQETQSLLAVPYI